jgi:hypothetical protein
MGCRSLTIRGGGEMGFWRAWIAFLAGLSAEPGMVEQERPRAAGAVAVAYATFATDSAPPPSPAPSDCVCGGTCRNGVWKPDGRIEQACPCPKTCKCKSKPAGNPRANTPACPDGRCPVK